MKNGFILFVALLLFNSVQAIQAQSVEYNYLNVVSNNYSEKHALASLKKITFANGMMQVHHDNSRIDYDLTSLNKLLFISQATGIGLIDTPAVGVYYDSITQSIYLQSEIDMKVLICDLSGRIVKAAYFDGSIGNSSMNINELPNGIYLVKVNNQVAKIIK